MFLYVFPDTVENEVGEGKEAGESAAGGAGQNEQVAPLLILEAGARLLQPHASCKQNPLAHCTRVPCAHVGLGTLSRSDAPCAPLSPHLVSRPPLPPRATHNSLQHVRAGASMREAQARTDLVPKPQTVPLPPPAPAADTGGTAAGAGRGKGGVGGFSVEWNLGANAVAGRLILRLKMQVRAYPPASPTVFLSFTVANSVFCCVFVFLLLFAFTN